MSAIRGTGGESWGTDRSSRRRGGNAAAKVTPLKWESVATQFHASSPSISLSIISERESDNKPSPSRVSTTHRLQNKGTRGVYSGVVFVAVE